MIKEALVTTLLPNISTPKLIIGAVAIVAAIALIVWYLRTRSIEKIRSDVYQLFLKAEHLMVESGSGPARLEWVVDKAYVLLPTPIQFIVTREMLKIILKNWFDEIKDLLDDGKNNDSVKLISNEESIDDGGDM